MLSITKIEKIFCCFQEISSKIDQNKDIIEQNNRNFNEMKKQRDALQNERKYVIIYFLLIIFLKANMIIKQQ